ncbi:MAG: ATP-binding protein [Armatimonadetes bacterium]|nr:ATP-binding protein [Armatimonadota bacterium]
MDEIALHILDLAVNAVSAGARRVTIAVTEDLAQDRLVVRVADDGKGMDAQHLDAVVERFASEKTGRRRPIALGLALLRQTAEQCGGEMRVESAPGQGTQVEVWMRHGHINRPPLGRRDETIFALCLGAPGVAVEFTHCRNGTVTHFDSAAVCQQLGPGASLQSPEGIRAVREALESKR